MQGGLWLEGISKSFPGVQALKAVRFDMRAGEVHALLGENGAGKSTLIKIVSGVHRPDQGSIRIDGQEVMFASPLEAQRAGIATIYQELLLFPELTVAENIFMGHAPRTRLGAIDWPQMRAQARALLASLEIHDLDVNQVVGTLSVGNRQRIEIAKALSQNARILIMDEPTAALTERDVERLFAIVRLLRTRGVGIVYISHRLEEIFLLADRVTVLPRRRVCRHQARERDRPRRTHPDDGRTQDRRRCSPSSRCRSANLSSSCAISSARAGDQWRQPDAAGGRDRRARRPGRLRAQRTGPGRLRHHARRQRRRSGSPAKPSPSATRRRPSGSASPTCRRIAAPRAWCGRCS